MAWKIKGLQQNKIQIIMKFKKLDNRENERMK